MNQPPPNLTLSRTLSLRSLGVATRTVKLAILPLLLGIALRSSYAIEPSFAPPAPERIAALLDFAGPVSLVRRAASAEELARASKSEGVPLASFSYSDPAHTSERITVAIYLAGTFLGEKRAEFVVWVTKSAATLPTAFAAVGVFPASNGRTVLQFLLGFGPGGGAYGALLPSRDARYELVIVQNTNAHDDEDPKQYSHHVSPRKDLKSVIEAIDAFIFP